MSDSLPPITDLTAKYPKTTVLTTLTGVLEFAANHIKDADYRQFLALGIPFISWAVIAISKTFYKRFKCKSLVKLHNAWIKQLTEEKKDPNTLSNRKREITKEIEGYRSEIKNLEKDAVGIDFY